MVAGEFKVTTRKQEVVAAALPLQQHWLPFSNLDALLPPLDVGFFFCYKNDQQQQKQEMGFWAQVGVLKKAMAQALVSFYALSGEVVHNSVGEPEILCNNRGVDFVEAFADVELKDLNLYNPDQSIVGKLFPNKEHGVLAVQATELKCGGMVVGCTFDHRIADAYSANMFLVSWAQLAHSETPSTVLPSFRRSLLNPRRPGHIHPSLNDMYIPITAMPPPPPPPPPPKHNNHGDDDLMISRIYHVASDQIHKLQQLASNGCSSGTNKRTKLESFCAFLWKMVAKCSTTSNVKKQCQMGIVVDGRKRLSEGENSNRVQEKTLMANYFGNVLSIPFGEKKIEELIKKPLNWVADEVHELLEQAVTKEHFLGLIDLVEAHRPVPVVAKISCAEGPAFMVSSGLRFPVSEVDFGWGPPLFGSCHFPWGGRGGKCGYVMPMPSPAGNGDWIVYMLMSKRQLEFMEKEAAHVFRPLTTLHYLN